MKLNKQILQDLINEATLKSSMILEEPTITESSFNRIKDKVDNTDIAFVVMSADRHNFSRNENDERLSKLKATFAKNGFPMTDIQGSWLEKDADGNEVRVIEKSIVVTDEERGDVPKSGISLLDLAMEMSVKYNQDAFIFGDIGRHTGKRSIDAYDPQGNRVTYGGPWTSIEPIQKDANFWSRVRGSTFIFKEAELEEYFGKPSDYEYPKKPVKPKKKEEIVEVDAPNSVIEAMRKAEQHKGKKIKFVRRDK